MLVLALLACAAPPEPVVVPAAAVAPAVAQPRAPEPIPAAGAFFRELAPGLTLAAYDRPVIAGAFSRPDPAAVADCDPRLFVVTIDPVKYELVYAHGGAPEGDGRLRTGPAWAALLDAHVVFNPGMFEPDGSGTGYSRGTTYTSQSQVRRNALYRGWFVAEPGDGPAAARVIDAVPPKGGGTYAPFADLPAGERTALERYGVVLQSLSVMREGKPSYPPRKNQWSELAFGADAQGRAVVVFSRHPYEMRELGALVAALDLGIRDLVHGEGGPEATLAIRVDGLEWLAVGSYETGFYDDSNRVAWGLPAVLAARPR